MTVDHPSRGDLALDELTVAFQGELERLNYSPRTVTDYGYNLRLLSRFLQERNLDAASMTVTVLTEFQRWLFFQPSQWGRARSVFNQNQVLASVKSL